MYIFPVSTGRQCSALLFQFFKKGNEAPSDPNSLIIEWKLFISILQNIIYRNLYFLFDFSRWQLLKWRLFFLKCDWSLFWALESKPFVGFKFRRKSLVGCEISYKICIPNHYLNEGIPTCASALFLCTSLGFFCYSC